MTFSICARETYQDDEGMEQRRFGLGIVTRLPRVGALCPFVNPSCAISTQSRLNRDLGRLGSQYVSDGLFVADALRAVLNADPHASHRQLHGIGPGDEFAFTGADCDPYSGDIVGENYTIAGNILTGKEVLTAMEEAFREDRTEARLAIRLLAALRAGLDQGGDRRTELEVQSGAIIIRDSEEREMTDPAEYDLRIDASRTPVDDLESLRDRAMNADRQVAAYMRPHYDRLS